MPLLAFVHGLLRPRIYLAEGLQQELTAPELEAVFRHELHHCRRLDPVRYSLVSTVADALFWIPLVPLAAERLITRLEYAADDAASERGALPLASAILRVAKVQATPMVDPGLSTPHLVERRVTRLLDAAGSTLPPIRTGVVVRSAVVLAAVWMLAIVSSASHTTHVTGCVRSSSETPHSAELGQCESADSGWDATFSRATDATGRLVHAVPPLLPRREPAARREDPV